MTEIENVPYKLPEGWKWVKLGDKNYFNIKTGGTPNTKIKDYWEDGSIPFITPKDLGKNNSKYISHYERKITIKGLESSSAKLVLKDTIVLSTRAPIGHLAITTENSVFNQGCKSVTPKDNISSTFVYYFLIINKNKLNKLGSGSTFKELSKEKLLNFLIALPFKNGKPDLEKQKQIVKKIDEIFRKIEKVEELKQKSLKKTKLLFNSILNKIFEEVKEENWEWVSLGEVGKVFSGTSAPQGKKYFKSGIYPFVRVSDLGRYRKTDNLEKIRDYVNDLAVREKGLVMAKKGTIIFPKSGAAILTNNRGIMGVDSYVVSHLACIKVVEIFYYKFIYYTLYNLDFEGLINNKAYPSITLKEIKEIKIPIPFKNGKPDLEKQKKIAEYLDKLNEKVKQLEKLQEVELKELKSLKESILNKAFRGELI